ncbi:MAG: cell wall-binding repeat-containing protein, partial [Euzebyales bacterium]|nr:cell wall-binding repeat-containing protein [Euzebyales bacterium]
RWEVSAAAASASRGIGMTARSVVAVSAGHWEETLAAGPYAAASGAPLVLVNSRRSDGAQPVQAWVQRHSAMLDAGVVAGSANSVAEEVRDRLSARLAGR